MRTSTPSPSADIEMVVRTLAVAVSGFSRFPGIHPTDWTAVGSRRRHTYYASPVCRPLVRVRLALAKVHLVH